MIKLSMKCDGFPVDEQMVFRLRTCDLNDGDGLSENDAKLISSSDGVLEFEFNGFSFDIYHDNAHDLDRDVVLYVPERQTVHRLIRANSEHNTLLVTEQCDQLCIMCSQPPKEHFFDLYDQFFEAILLAPLNCTIGISGGEPTLHKDRLFDFLVRSLEAREDLSFHVLTNGQHFTHEDQPFFTQAVCKNVMWGIPLYSHISEKHDQIVGKQGAFEIVRENISLLSEFGVNIELRTVVLNSNFEALPEIALFISSQLPSVQIWAIMQMENIGFGRRIWKEEFCDTSINFESIADAINISQGRGVETLLYNFPLCTVPLKYNKYAVRSISDWKQRYLKACLGCSMQSECSGFFEWYRAETGFKKIIAI
jgi:His-Xaa-Ser system radical SAM maturase HxsC